MMIYRNVLELSPFDDNFKFGMDKKQFYKELMTQTSQVKSAKENLLMAIDPNRLEFNQYILLYGYSGNGKTTFVNWFFDEVIKANEELNSKYCLVYTSPTLNPTQPEIGENLIIETIKSELIDKLRDTDYLEHVAIKKNVFDRHFEKRSWQNIMYLITIRKSREASFHDYKDCVDNLTFIEALTLYCFYHIVQQDNEERRIIFCFDNLDGVAYEFLTKELWRAFLRLNVKLKQLYASIIGGEIDFKKKVGFLLVLREANVAKYHAEINDRMILNEVGKQNFLIGAEAKKIIQSRFNYAQQKKMNFEAQALKDLSHVIFEKDFDFLDQVLSPLFNYDIRALTQAMIYIVRTEIVNEVSQRIFNLSLDDYNSIYDCKNIKEGLFFPKNGSRGILYNTFIFFLIKRNLVQSLAEDTGNIDFTRYGLLRPSRIILTTLYNLCYPHGIKEDEVSSFNKMFQQQVGLYDLYLQIQGFGYTYEVFFSRIEELFKVREHGSWGHFITIYNKDMNKGFIAEKKLLRKIIIDDNISDFDKQKYIDELNKIRIGVNSSGYIYLRYLIKHFEFFNCLVHANGQRSKPLFLSTNVIFQERDSPICEFEFESLIKNVFQKVKTCKGLMSQYMRNYVLNDEFELEHFLSSYNVFKDSKGKGRLYSSRVISTHIRYLDDFREFLYFSKKIRDKIEKYIKIHKGLRLRSMVDIQNFIVDYIERYNELLIQGRSIVDKNMNLVYRGHCVKIARVRSLLEENLMIRSEDWIKIDAKE